MAGAQARSINWSTEGDGCTGDARLELIRDSAIVAELGTTELIAGYLTVVPPSDLPLAGNYRLRLTSLDRPALVAESSDFWAGPAITCHLGIGRPLRGDLAPRLDPSRALVGQSGLRGAPYPHRGQLPGPGRGGRRGPRHHWAIPADFPLGLTTVRLVVPEDPRITSPSRSFLIAP